MESRRMVTIACRLHHLDSMGKSALLAPLKCDRVAYRKYRVIPDTQTTIQNY
ncbi:MAG: hypothetical protein KME54_12160 [Tolypothrix brevis GSE-NOS-MK-07-07A]|nr:hypothetical protein [Tolypothrix brevis GSE-NOS-MK-07-07A]